MAKVIKAPNPLRKQAHKWLMSIFVLWLSSVFFFALLEILDLLKYTGLPLLGFVSMMTGYYGRMYTISANGLKGERRALSLVSKIPASYTVFSNVRLAFEGKESETDLIVVGEKGVFLIEVKNHNGRITGFEADKRWVQHKVGKKGGHYANPFYSPVKQVNTHVFRLSSILKEQGFPYWIQGVVYFTNPEVDLRVQTKRIPVLSRNRRFNHYLDEYHSRRLLTRQEIDLVVSTIQKQIQASKRHKT